MWLWANHSPSLGLFLLLLVDKGGCRAKLRTAVTHREVEHKSTLLTGGQHIGTFSKESSMENVKKAEFTVEKADEVELEGHEGGEPMLVYLR